MHDPVSPVTGFIPSQADRSAPVAGAGQLPRYLRGGHRDAIPLLTGAPRPHSGPRHSAEPPPQHSTLAARYRSADPIDLDGATVYPMYSEQLPTPVSALTMTLLSATPPTGLTGVGIGLSVIDGYIDLDDRRLSGVDIWRDALERGITFDLAAESPHALFALTPVWSNTAGEPQSWSGNYGIVVERTELGRTVLWCSMGEGPPHFADLVIEVRSTPLDPGPRLFTPGGIPTVSTATPPERRNRHHWVDEPAPDEPDSALWTADYASAADDPPAAEVAMRPTVDAPRTTQHDESPADPPAVGRPTIHTDNDSAAQTSSSTAVPVTLDIPVVHPAREPMPVASEPDSEPTASDFAPIPTVSTPTTTTSRPATADADPVPRPAVSMPSPDKVTTTVLSAPAARTTDESSAASVDHAPAATHHSTGIFGDADLATPLATPDSPPEVFAAETAGAALDIEALPRSPLGDSAGAATDSVSGPTVDDGEIQGYPCSFADIRLSDTTFEKHPDTTGDVEATAPHRISVDDFPGLDEPSVAHLAGYSSGGRAVSETGRHGWAENPELTGLVPIIREAGLVDYGPEPPRSAAAGAPAATALYGTPLFAGDDTATAYTDSDDHALVDTLADDSLAPVPPADRAPTDDDSDPARIHLLGAVAHAQGDDDRALLLWDRAARAGHLGAIYDLGALSLRRDDPDSAERWWRAAAGRRMIPAMAELATLLEQRGAVAEARMWRTQAVAEEVIATAARRPATSGTPTGMR